MPLHTPAAQWSVDKDWQRKANSVAREAEKRANEIDQQLLEKRRKGRLLKVLAMEQTYKGLAVKKK